MGRWWSFHHSRPQSAAVAASGDSRVVWTRSGYLGLGYPLVVSHGSASVTPNPWALHAARQGSYQALVAEVNRLPMLDFSDFSVIWDYLSAIRVGFMLGQWQNEPAGAMFENQVAVKKGWIS